MENKALELLRDNRLHNRIVSADEAASWIKDGMTLGISGFTHSGDAKAVPFALIERAKKDPFKVNILTGASLGYDLDKLMAEAGIVNKRWPFQSDKTMRTKINAGEILFIDQHLSHTTEWLRNETFGKIDYAIVEAIAITKDGMIIPSASTGNSAMFIKKANAVIIELNLAQPAELEGIHDIYDPGEQGSRKPIPLTKVDDRIGTVGIPVDIEKIKGIVVTNIADSSPMIIPPDEETAIMANNLIDFLHKEMEAGRLSKQLPPLQSGVGSVANAVLHGLMNSEFDNLEIYSEVLQDAVFDLIDAGKVRFASGCSLTLSEEKLAIVRENFANYKDKLILRTQEISNYPEIIRRLGLISINTAIELDIYGNVNSTHIAGTNMMNGIGGSGDFARNSHLGIFVTKSIAKNGDISSIVPFVSHVDHTEHDVDIIVTEQGYADLRGLAPTERAPLIIEKCAHPLYRKQLHAYYNEALSRGGHTPHVLEKAFSWHLNLKEHGTMLEKNLIK